MTTIRQARPADLPGAYRVCLLTGDAGRDGSARYRNPELLGHVYVGAYILGAPETALVVADAEGIAGYCLVAADTRAFESWCEASWWPPLREQYPLDHDPSPDGELVRLIHAPEVTPDRVVAAYPAHLHVDLLERTRGKGLGRALVERQLDQLRERGVPGIHLGVAASNANAITFYRHLGFDTLEASGDGLTMAMGLG